MRRASSLPLLAILTVGLAACQADTTFTSVPPAPVQQETPHCEDSAPSGILRVAPADPGRRYLRCGTLGGEVRWHVRLSPNHARLAARTSVGTVRLIATEPWRELVELASPLGRIDAMAFSPDGAQLATLSVEAGQVALWRTLDGTLERTYAVRTVSTALSPRGAAIAFSDDGRQIATSLQRILDLESGQTRAWSYPSGAPQPDFRELSFAPGGSLLADGLYRELNSELNETVMLVHPGTQQHTVLFSGWASTLRGHAFSADRSLVALATDGEPTRGLRVYRVGQAAPAVTDPAFTGSVLAFSPDGTRLYTSVDAQVEVRDAMTLAVLSRFGWPAESRFLALSPSGDLVASAGHETTWWDPQTGAPRRTLPEALTAVTWSADGALGAGTGGEALVNVWRESDGGVHCLLPRRDAALPVLSTSLPTSTSPMTTAAPMPTSIAIPDPAKVTVVAQASNGSVLATRDVNRFGDTWISLVEAGTGKTLRVFADNPPAVYAGHGIGVALSDDGAQAFTLEAEGALGQDPYVAVWCR